MKTESPAGSVATPICEKCGGRIHGHACKLCEMFETGSTPLGHTAGSWPIRSDALGCHPSQIAEIMERNKKAGVTGVSYDPADGTAIIDSRQERKKLIAAEGYHDKDGGYGD